MAARRRDLGNAIALLGVILLCFVGYHAWVKPEIPLPENPPAKVSTENNEDEGEEPSEENASPPITKENANPRPLPVPDGTPLPTAPSAKVVENEVLPETDHSEQLKKINHLIKDQHGAEAEAMLGELAPEITSNPELSLYIATLWNNLGVLKTKLRGPEAGISAYKKGLSLNPKGPALNLNLAHAYWETHDPALTKTYLEDLTKLVPDDPFPHLALADLLYGEDDLIAATGHLEMATQRAKADPGLKAYLDMVTAKIKGEEKIERQLSTRKSSHFVVKFDGTEDYQIWEEVLRILENSYREIGQALGYFPKEPIHVVLMTKEHFQSDSGTPAWADALFDPVLGRIKIPTQGALTEKAWLTKVLRHEYVHALLHERMGIEASRVPRWLNEGLAMQLAGDPWPDLDQMTREGKIKIIPLQLLEGWWGQLPVEAATVAYLEANSATKYLIERYGMDKVRAILSRLKAGDTIAGAIHDKLMISYDSFQKRWKENLLQKLAKKK